MPNLLLIIFMLSLLHINTEFVKFKTGEVNYPGNTYQVNCEKGQTIIAQLAFYYQKIYMSPKLGYEIYVQGQDLKKSVPIATYYYSSIKYSCNELSKHYLKVVVYNNFPLAVGYRLNVTLYENSTSKFQHIDSVGSIYKSMINVATVLFSTQKNYGCKLAISYSPQCSYLQAYIDLYSPSGQKKINQSSQQSDINVQANYNQYGDWALIFYLNATDFQDLCTFTYNIYYNNNFSECCEGDYVWNNFTMSCQTLGFENAYDEFYFNCTPLIIGIVCGVVVVLAILIGILVYYKKCRNRAPPAKRNLGDNSQEYFEKTSNQIKTSKETIYCPICLQSNCNTTLKCNHIFHQNCIRTWFKKNKICPLCRTEALNSRVN